MKKVPLLKIPETPVKFSPMPVQLKDDKKRSPSPDKPLKIPSATKSKSHAFDQCKNQFDQTIRTNCAPALNFIDFHQDMSAINQYAPAMM